MSPEWVGSKTVCLDFDGVLAYYTEWKGEDVIGEPVLGGFRLAELLHDAGIDLVVHTCRLNGDFPDVDYDTQYRKIREWLDTHGLTYVRLAGIGEGKPFAHCYVDDRGVHFPPNCIHCAEAVYSTVMGMLYKC